MGAQAIGFAAALLLGGALTEYGPWPTRLCFWVLALFLIVLLTGTWFLPRHTPGGAGRRPFTVSHRNGRDRDHRPDPLATDGADRWRAGLWSGQGAAHCGGQFLRSADLPAGDGHGGRGVQPVVCRPSASDQRVGSRAQPWRHTRRPLSPELPVDGRACPRSRCCSDSEGGLVSPSISVQQRSS
jgi:hypothetical protein